MRPLRQLQARRAAQRRQAEPTRRPAGALTWGKGGRILLLTQQADAEAVAAARAFAKTHQQRGSGVDTLTYSPERRAKDQSPQPEVWTPAELQFSGLPTEAAEAPWRGRDYDVAIHVAREAFAPFDYLAAGLRAHRRVAAYDTAFESYDLVVTPHPGSGYADFLEQVAYYLERLSPHYA